MYKAYKHYNSLTQIPTYLDTLNFKPRVLK